MKQLFDTQHWKLAFQDKIPEELTGNWKELIAEAVQSESIFFPRCTRPPAAVGNPLVIYFSDWAFPGYNGAVADILYSWVGGV